MRTTPTGMRSLFLTSATIYAHTKASTTTSRTNWIWYLGTIHYKSRCLVCAHICIDSWSGIGGVFRFNQRTTHRNTGTPHANLSSQAHACVICAACQGFVRAMGAGRNFFESSDSNCNAMDWIRHRVACQLPRHN